MIPIPALNISKLTVRRGSFRLVVEDLRLNSGSVVIAGPNGSGKSTLLAALAGLLPWRGEVSVGEDPLRGSGSAEQIAYMPQEPLGLEHMVVCDALAYARLLSRTEATLDGIDMLLGIDHLGDKRIGELSGGQRRLVYVAASVLHRPGVLLLDEPTSGIDALHRHALRDFVHELAKECLVVTASHLPDDVARLGDRTVFMREGRVIFDGSNTELHDLGVPLADGVGAFEAALAQLERRDR